MDLKLSSNVAGVPKRHSNCGFKNFNTNVENKKQFEICKNWDGSTSITLTGKTGTGKTHLALAMLRNFPQVVLNDSESEKNKSRLEYQIASNYKWSFDDGTTAGNEYTQKLIDSEIWKYRKAYCLFVSFVELFVEINNAAMGEEGKMRILKEYSNNRYDCVCFDDLGAEKLTEAKRENLYYIIDSRYREMLPTIITSNFTISEISETEPRIASRLAEMGQILQFNGNDFRKNT